MLNLIIVLAPVIIVAIAAKLIINSLDKQVDTLLALNNYQEEHISSLKAVIDNYEDILVDINSLNHPSNFDKAQDSYDHQDEDSEFIMSAW